MTAPPLAVQQPDGSRRYVHPRTGESVPSVTTVLDVIAKPALIPWAAKMAAQHAVANWSRLSVMPTLERVEEIRGAHIEYAEKKADIGDHVHELIQCWMTGTPFPEVNKNAGGYVNSFIGFMTAARPRFIENEVTVWSRKHGYAGTADCIAEISGKVILVDWKSGRRIYPEVALQVSALAGADFIIRPDGTEEPIPQVDGLAALHIRPRGWKLTPIYEQGESFAAFLAARKLLRWQQEIAPNVFQEALWANTRSSLFRLSRSPARSLNTGSEGNARYARRSGTSASTGRHSCRAGSSRSAGSAWRWGTRRSPPGLISLSAATALSP